MDINDIIDEVMDDVEQYAEQRANGHSFEEAQAAVELRQALDEYVDVDEVRYIGPDPSLMYYHDESEKKHEVATIALVAAEAAEYIPSVLAVTALESETERHAHFRVERPWLDEYDAGEIDKKTLAQRALNSWSTY